MYEEVKLVMLFCPKAAGGLLAGGAIKLIIDKVIFILISKNRDKLAQFIAKEVEKIDNKFIDPYKKKYPEAGAEFEQMIADTLIKSANKILDK